MKSGIFGIYTPFWEVFAHFSIGKGPIFDRKIPDLEKEALFLYFYKSRVLNIFSLVAFLTFPG